MMQDAAHAKGVQLLVLEASNDIEATFGSLIGLHAGALVVQSNPFFTQRGQQLVTLAAQYSLPATYHLRGFVAAGDSDRWKTDADANVAIHRDAPTRQLE
jgi:hypothetical protein